jgi:hypothetical protein
MAVNDATAEAPSTSAKTRNAVLMENPPAEVGYL